MIDAFRHHTHRSRLQWLGIGLATLVFWASPAVAQHSGDEASPVTPWTRPNHESGPQEFQFAVVSDRAANPREGVFRAALAKLRLLRPEFVLSVGDFIHGYGAGMKPLTDESLVREKRRKFDGMLEILPVPFYRVPGNHDINNDLSAGIWKELYGPAYYSFLYRNVLFLCLNSQDGQGYRAGLGKEQLSWAGEVLAQHSDARWVCLFFHQPLWLEDEKRLAVAQSGGGTPQLTGFNEIEELLEGRNFTVFAGHHHRYGKWVKNGQKYFRLATTGGQSSLSGPESGQFDHVMWVTMTDEGPVICNLLLDGILDEDAKSSLTELPSQGR
jgi:3',5'-cyclic AMP phosphodiesterase CpdA